MSAAARSAATFPVASKTVASTTDWNPMLDRSVGGGVAGLRVYLARHGESVNNAGQALVEDPPLTARGRWQAARLAETWDRLPVDGIVCSPLWRSLETATPLAARLGVPLFGWPDLVEVNRSWPQDGHASADVAARFPHVSWAPSLDAVGWPMYPGEESEAQVAVRAKQVAARIAAAFPAAGAVVLVGHAGFTQGLLRHWLGAPVSTFFPSGNCHVHALNLAGDGSVRLEGANMALWPESTDGG